jgi:membrane fusion protein, multidrug efflux system
VRYAASILFIALAAGACSNTEQITQTETATPVSVLDVALQPIEEYVTTTGTVSATEEAAVTTQASGYYKIATNPKTGRPFTIGDRVAKNQVIIELDNPDQVASLQIESKQLDLKLAETEYKTQQTLYKLGGITEKELNSAQKSFLSSQYSYNNALTTLEKQKVKAPIDGIIVEMPYFTPGIMVNSNAAVATIMDYATLYMQVNLPGKILGRIQSGQKVRVSNYNIPDTILDGRITQVAPVLDPDGRTFLATLSISNPNLQLRPGMFIKADVVVARKDSTVVIAKDQIISRRGSQKMVFVVDRGVAMERVITTGIENPDSIEVVTGLSVGDRLVTVGYETLRGRARVRINE